MRMTRTGWLTREGAKRTKKRLDNAWQPVLESSCLDIVFAAVLGLIAGPGASAQSTYGTILGNVKDASGD